MWLIREALGWIFLVGMAVGLVTLGMSYRVLGGRRENLLVLSLKRGCIGGALITALLVPLVVLVAWLAS
jgi:hypothetical protein